MIIGNVPDDIKKVVQRFEDAVKEKAKAKYLSPEDTAKIEQNYVDSKSRLLLLFSDEPDIDD